MAASKNPVWKALWFIEAHSTGDISLDALAKIAGITRYQMSRTFGLVVGRTIPEYVRARRLSEAARRLAQGAPDILAVALDVGYGSHESFTRAFRDQFGLTPEAVRAQGHTNNLNLLEAIRMDGKTDTKLETPRVVEGKSMLIAGLAERYGQEASARIPAQWQRFVPYLGNIPGQLGNITYGVLCHPDEAGQYEYITGVEVSSFSQVAAEFTRLRVAPQTYAVFTHSGHVAEIRKTWMAIFNQWLPQSGYRSVEAPEFERYDERFNPRTGMGEVEIWIPIQKLR